MLATDACDCGLGALAVAINWQLHLISEEEPFLERKTPGKNKFRQENVKKKNPPGKTKQTTLERADFTLQLSMFVTTEEERRMFIIFFLSSFCQLLSP